MTGIPIPFRTSANPSTPIMMLWADIQDTFTAKSPDTFLHEPLPKHVETLPLDKPEEGDCMMALTGGVVGQ